MRHRLMTVLMLLVCLTQLQPGFAAGDPQDRKGSKDPDLFSRMRGFHIYRSEVKEFDRYEFQLGPDKKETAEGKYSFVIYYANEGVMLPGGLQIIRNYAHAAKATSGQQLYEYADIDNPINDSLINLNKGERA